MLNSNKLHLTVNIENKKNKQEIISELQIISDSFLQVPFLPNYIEITIDKNEIKNLKKLNINYEEQGQFTQM